MTFKSSIELLSFHNTAYTIYAIMIISIIAWFGYNLTRKEKVASKIRIPFYGYIGFLVVGGVGHHIFTYNTIPWVEQDMKRAEIKPEQAFKFEVKDHKWVGLPKTPIKVKCNETVRFTIDSKDLVYGFGLFREKDGSLATQMQVNPGTDVNNILRTNDIVWTFRHNGKFYMTSTEYSGTAQYTEDGKDLMRVDNFLEVTGCNEGGAK